LILDEGTDKRETGKIKFYDSKNKFGFIVIDSDGSDIFVHQDDLDKSKIEVLGGEQRFSF
jgi:cold shock CspA family protein